MEIPRWWRNEHPYLDGQGERCLNCGSVGLAIGRPVCPSCRMIYKPEKTVTDGEIVITTHRIIGSKDRVDIFQTKRNDDGRIPVDLTVRRRIVVSQEVI